MKTVRPTKWQVLMPLLIWWLIFIGLSTYNFNRFQILNIVGFLFLTIVPGFLTMLTLRLKGLAFWGYAALTVAFSLFELMIMALLGNTFFPFIGIARPLEKTPLLFELYPLIAVLAAVAWLRMEELVITFKRYALFDRAKDYFFSFAPIIFVALSVLGAISLNDGGGNVPTMIMLGLMGIYLCFLMYHAKSLDTNTIPTTLFFISLALLLMTDLRGWYITGHDIQSEYKVFELAKTAGIWSMAAYRDAYNACLSITILPTIFSNLLQIPDPYIFKLFFQIFFAFCPVLVYLTARHWTSQRISLISTIFFIGFPTFFTDMPFLVRQEVAFLFFGLMLYIIFNESLPLTTRRWLFMLMGIGVVLSHYSTTYTILIILGLAVISRPLFIALLKKYRNWTSPDLKIAERGRITFVMVALLFVLSFLWTTIITQTGSSVTNVIKQTLTAVQQGFGGDNRSVDVTTLLSFSTPDQTHELQSYLKQNVEPIRNAAPAGTYFSSSTYSQYPLPVLQTETIPPTSLGTFFQNFNINMGAVMGLFGQLIEKLTEILVPLGMVYLLIRKGIVKYLDSELYLISCYCLIFIGMNIVLPVLSTEYGIFRAMQQSMFIIGPMIVAGSILIGNGLLEFIKPLKKYLTAEGFAMILGATFFFYSTHFLPYLFGNAPAALHLSNTGTYYDDYLIQETEVYGVNWLTTTIGTNADEANGVRLVVQANHFNNFASLTTVSPDADILPEVIAKNAYVFLGPITVNKGRATVIYAADQITYQYPIQFLENNKDAIYNNGGAEVYR